MMESHGLSRLAELPIPRDVVPGPGWCPLMIEMADHIGAWSVLQLCDAFGGAEFYIPVSPVLAGFRFVLGDEKATTLCRVYRGETLIIPRAVHALARARRAAIIAQVIEGRMKTKDGAALAGVRRTWFSQLVKQAKEERDWTPPVTPSSGDQRQIDMFPKVTRR